MSQVKSKKQKTNYQNPIEMLKNMGSTAGQIGADAARELQQELLRKSPQSIMEQILPGYASGDIEAGESIEIQSTQDQAQQEQAVMQKQLLYERRVHQEEEARIERKTNELRMQLKILVEEVQVLAESTQDLGEEIKIAAMQAPIEPGLYHVVFFEKLVSFIKSFREKINDAQIWLHASNNRAQKKNYWSMYKKYKGKFLLSGEHYVTRSAG